MAVYAAHLTRTLQGSPSVFQVAAQEALGATVRPAIQRLVEYLSALYPGRFDWCIRWYDELFLLLDTCLQYHYIKHYAASFSESFYGLERAARASKLGAEFGDTRLTETLERASLLLLVLPSYLKIKFDTLAIEWRTRLEDGQLTNSISDRCKKLAVHLHATLHALWGCARLATLAAYAVKGGSPHPSLLLLGITLRAAPPRASSPSDPTWTDLIRAIATLDFRTASETAWGPLIGGGILRGAEYAAFCVHALRWWNLTQPQAVRTKLPVPPPPTKLEVRSRNVCPACGGRWRTPVAIRTSGAILCYSCARIATVCPVTKLPFRPDQLVRLYLPE